MSKKAIIFLLANIPLSIILFALFGYISNGLPEGIFIGHQFNVLLTYAILNFIIDLVILKIHRLLKIRMILFTALELLLF